MSQRFGEWTGRGRSAEAPRRGLHRSSLKNSVGTDGEIPEEISCQPHPAELEGRKLIETPTSLHITL